MLAAAVTLAVVKLPKRGGASWFTLLRRARYRGRKSRSAVRKLLAALREQAS